MEGTRRVRSPDPQQLPFGVRRERGCFLRSCFRGWPFSFRWPALHSSCRIPYLVSRNANGLADPHFGSKVSRRN